MRRSAVAIATLALMSACAGSTADHSASGSADARAAPVLLQASAQPPEAKREVVYTADLVVRVADISRATTDATRAVQSAGGFVFSQNSDEDETTLTLKVPSDRFDPVLAAVARVGRELRRSIKAQDVTAEVVDVEGRLKTAQASADRLRSLLSGARSASEVVAVEGELSKREAEIESFQGRLRVLRDQVSLATITARLTRRNDVQLTKDTPGFLGGLRTGWIALVNIGLALVVVGGFLLPFVPFVALALWVVRRRRRRRRPRPESPPVTAS